MQTCALPKILSLRGHPALFDEAATWFNAKWGVPVEAYRDSFLEAAKSTGGVPDWFVVQYGGKIVAGCGIIENDFHLRRDLSPNVCAVYVEPPYRNRGIARALLDNACAKLADHGIDQITIIP